MVKDGMKASIAGPEMELPDNWEAVKHGKDFGYVMSDYLQEEKKDV